MSDIIQDAKKLLEGATPGPWVMEETEVTHRLLGGEAHEFGGEPMLVVGGDLEEANAREHEDTWDEPPYFYLIHRAEDGELMAASRELAQSLAEETWEYQVQSRSMKQPAWKPSTNGILQKWYGAEDIEEAKDKAQMYTPYFRGRENVEIRVLRRRVSRPEVINE